MRFLRRSRDDIEDAWMPDTNADADQFVGQWALVAASR